MTYSSNYGNIPYIVNPSPILLSQKQEKDPTIDIPELTLMLRHGNPPKATQQWEGVLGKNALNAATRICKQGIDGDEQAADTVIDIT